MEGMAVMGPWAAPADMEDLAALKEENKNEAIRPVQRIGRMAFWV